LLIRVTHSSGSFAYPSYPPPTGAAYSWPQHVVERHLPFFILTTIYLLTKLIIY
jgi:hypothetical protein